MLSMRSPMWDPNSKFCVPHSEYRQPSLFNSFQSSNCYFLLDHVKIWPEHGQLKVRSRFEGIYTDCGLKSCSIPCSSLFATPSLKFYLLASSEFQPPTIYKPTILWLSGGMLETLWYMDQKALTSSWKYFLSEILMTFLNNFKLLSSLK